ncbi:MAG: hypothetical protein A2499_09860 [Stygiobacter sp. RIFOXYC12_FULL_38_8]|nr:MAG: hypothetical protein A2279_00405 [Stygiobacter sp. RIFOXYA12_FULL_38_9]OGV06077.1 MAG: hypothetical protein A2299_07675 [Stygiobacter sp. RIFOXYB2_FULL_37_11]OGV10202.1 MAG: hypothetical protein A2237_15260 [Stygiobacter sp. RIFOXYA2_FULL_38_8]OGV16859.1 MAG: hypothetical protein A2440_05840 [Stygiobacter sp. RIFOXYC2_FULL_38_25]OGV28510.1 MAG: hypothetical protein A2499_09860 [Stygiobacter sp. RIFOXYC12_FULL_38_8]OGV82790.1 MAG: hypothetical protein A2X65_12315 [Stygiobacter sp. GWF2_
MKKNPNKHIEIHKVEGNVVISQDQKGGVTTNSINSFQMSTKRKWSLIVLFIGLIASVVTILTYFGINPSSSIKKNEQREAKPNSVNTDTLDKKTKVVTQEKIIKGKKMLDKKEEKPINIENVEGDVIISQNQSGGITAHSINVNQAITPEWRISESEKLNDTEWRTKLTARGKGNLTFHNWNILLTLNTRVIRKEDVPGEVTVGPWTPLEIRGGNLSVNHFFLGFAEFKPGQGFSIYLYSSEPLKVLNVESIGE